MPDSIHSDQCRSFVSKFFEEMCHLLQIRKSRSTAYHPERNGQVTHLIKKDGGRLRRSSVVQFINLRLYKRKPIKYRKGEKGAAVGCKSPQERYLEQMNEEWAQDNQDSEAPQEAVQLRR